MKTLQNRDDALEILRRLDAVRPDSARRWGSDDRARDDLPSERRRAAFYG
jgi:hypothetical protein